MSRLARVRNAVAARFSVDRRALAALRVVLAAAVLVDLALRLPDVRAFYTDAGVLPRDLLFELYPTLGRASLHALSGALWWQYVLFACLGVAAVAMAVGYRTRLATVITACLLISLQLRNPVVLNSGHSLLRRLLLWSALLPLGARWSVDARHRSAEASATDGADRGSGRVRSLAAAGLLVQVLAVYVVNAAVKARGDAWAAGTAGRLVFGMDALTVLLGDVVAGFPTLLTAGTYAWVALLVASPLLVLATGRARAALVAAFAAGHVAMALTLRLGVFPLVSLGALLPFLPSFVWERVERVVDDRLAPRADAATDRLGLAAGSGARTPLLPSTVRDLGAGSGRALAAALLAFVLVWNAAALGLLALPASVTDTVDPEERRWDMFAPEPRSTGGWWVTVGTTTTGERVDLSPGTASTAMPPDVDATYPGHRWYFYLTTLRDSPPPPAALGDRFPQYLCERWNRRHDSTLESANVTFVARTVVLDGPDRIDVRPFGVTDCAGTEESDDGARAETD
ncbi:HTTM domain-containing protein [Halorubellus sp. PRR65]|uniref:HTTM domain-containing protein n=1 Tax=Halorubellus sp. PRR65 TaxID=3098148 RepID=UPI002B25D8E2|nr:HTTM domain-containing protein [Halorubellus sp. PRR65]